MSNNKTLNWLVPSVVLILGVLLLVLAFNFIDQSVEIGTTLGIIGLIIGSVAIGLFFRFNENNPQSVKKLKDEIKFKYQLDDLLVSNDLSGVVGFSKERNTLYLMTRADISTGIEILNSHYMIDAFPLESINSVNIIENDIVIVNSTNKASIGKSVSGGFGNEGIQNKKVIFKVRIQAITKDVIKPSSDVFLYSSNIGLKRNSNEHLELYKTINEFFDKMKVVLNKQMSY